MNFSILTKRQVNNVIIFNDHEKKAKITDYATSLGGKNEDGIGTYYIQRPIFSPMVSQYINSYIDNDGNYRFNDGLLPTEIGIRPVVLYFELLGSSKDLNLSDNKIIYGEYPQTKVDKDLNDELDNASNGRDIFLTNKVYTIAIGLNNTPIKLCEYRYKGNKYVNTSYYHGHDWFKVEPITWLVDNKTKLAITEKILLAGIKYGEIDSMINLFSQSDIYSYLKVCFSKEILASEIPEEEIKKSEENRISYLKNIKYELTDKLLKVELLEVQIKTELFAKRLKRTLQVQEALNDLKDKEKLLEEKIKEIELEITDCTNENVFDTKELIKRIS